jgi:hypothetical protein
MPSVGISASPPVSSNVGSSPGESDGAMGLISSVGIAVSPVSSIGASTGESAGADVSPKMLSVGVLVGGMNIFRSI